MTKFIASKIKKFVAQIDDWKAEFLDFPEKTSLALKAHANEWLDRGEAIYIQGMNDIRVSTAYETFKRNAKLVGQEITIADFKEVYATEIATLGRVDLTKARMLRNNIARNLQGNLDSIYAEFDAFSKEALGMSLYDVKKEFMDKANFYEIINFNDSAGRKWNPETYAEMWARTRSSEIASEVQTQAMEEYDLDIIQISDHNTDTPVCMEYEGKYFSRFGKTPGLPVIDMMPPFHPNCQHTAFAVDPRYLGLGEMQKENEHYSELAEPTLNKLTGAEQAQVDKQKEYYNANRV